MPQPDRSTMTNDYSRTASRSGRSLFIRRMAEDPTMAWSLLFFRVLGTLRRFKPPHDRGRVPGKREGIRPSMHGLLSESSRIALIFNRSVPYRHLPILPLPCAG